MCIKFNAPPLGFSLTPPNPFSMVPQQSGVYIIGVKILVDDFDSKDGEKKEKFCPLCVGQTTDLQNRFVEHRGTPHRAGVGSIGASTGMNTDEELFDFINNKINLVYQSIHWWNLLHWNWLGNNFNGRYDPYLTSAYPGIGQDVQKIVLYNFIRKFGNAMIYFRCRSFFDFYLRDTPSTHPIVGVPITNLSNHRDTLAYLTSPIANSKMKKLAKKITDVKTKMYNNFYFAYALEADWRQFYPALSLDEAEAFTKSALEDINIFTYQKCIQKIHNDRLAPLGSLPKPAVAYNIDLDSIRMSLVNLTGVPFSNPLIIGQ
jgi:hypothetical protein